MEGSIGGLFERSIGIEDSPKWPSELVSDNRIGLLVLCFLPNTLCSCLFDNLFS